MQYPMDHFVTCSWDIVIEHSVPLAILAGEYAYQAVTMNFLLYYILYVIYVFYYFYFSRLFGHEGVKLLPYNCDLNPIEYLYLEPRETEFQTRM